MVDPWQMEEPCQCECGEWFDLGDGNPCHNDEEHRGEPNVFCSSCATHTEFGWLCKRCYRKKRAQAQGRCPDCGCFVSPMARPDYCKRCEGLR